MKLEPDQQWSDIEEDFDKSCKFWLKVIGIGLVIVTIGYFMI